MVSGGKGSPARYSLSPPFSSSFALPRDASVASSKKAGGA